MPTTGERFERAVSIMARLRAPGGCPWDREQTFDSIKPYTLEETYEVFEAIDNRDWKELEAELGDLLLQVLFYSEMAEEQSSFSIDDVLDRLAQKLIDRHPHVFGDVKAETDTDVIKNWEMLKAAEREKREPASDRPPSLLAGVSRSMPALLEAHKLSSKASQAGFDWPNVEGLLDKLREETAELEDLMEGLPAAGPRPRQHAMAGSRRSPIAEELKNGLEEELGDMLFVVVNLARFLSLDPESALRKTNRKFRRRFEWIEQQLRLEGKAPQQASMDELELLWQRAKQEERSGA